MRAIRIPTTTPPQSSPRDAHPPAGDGLPLQRVRRRGWRRFLSRAPIAICAAVLFALCISYITLLRSGAVHIQQSDVLVYYSASHLVLGGHGSAIYSFPTLKAVESSLLHSLLTVRNQAVFLYPPFVALALTPLAAVGYSAAYLLWFILNCLLLVGVLVALQRYLRLSRSGSVLLVVAGVSFFPVFATLAQGQVSMLLLAILIASFLALRAQREGWAGALLALALIKPPYVLPFLLLLLVQARWRALAGFAATAVALAVLPMAVLGPSINQGYLQLLRQAAGWHTTTGGFSAQANQNLAGFFQLLCAAPVATVLQWGFSVAALAAVAVIAHRRRPADLPFAAATVAALLVNPHVLVHDLSLLLIAAAIAIRHARAQEPTLWLLLTAGYVVALAGIPLSHWIPIQLSVLVMAALLLWLLRTCTGALGVTIDCPEDNLTTMFGMYGNVSEHNLLMENGTQSPRAHADVEMGCAGRPPEREPEDQVHLGAPGGRDITEIEDPLGWPAEALQ